MCACVWLLRDSGSRVLTLWHAGSPIGRPVTANHCSSKHLLQNNERFLFPSVGGPVLLSAHHPCGSSAPSRNHCSSPIARPYSQCQSFHQANEQALRSSSTTRQCQISTANAVNALYHLGNPLASYPSRTLSRTTTNDDPPIQKT